MKYARPVLIALLIMLLDPLAPLLVLLALPFAKWDDAPSLDSNGKGLTIRGDLPAWASWLGTPNERLPGGTYEPAVTNVLQTFGRFWCSWYWLGLRNRWYGIAATFAVPLGVPWGVAPGYYEDGELWWLRYPLFGNRLQFKAGYRQYFTNGAWVGVPACTITKA
jgi:hypothetical protein